LLNRPENHGILIIVLVRRKKIDWSDDWIGMEFTQRVSATGTDYDTLKVSFVLITQLQLDVTAYLLFEYLNPCKL